MNEIAQATNDPNEYPTIVKEIYAGILFLLCLNKKTLINHPPSTWGYSKKLASYL